MRGAAAALRGLTLGLVLGLAPGCGGAAKAPPITAVARPEAPTAGDRILPLLPAGAQVIVEIDLARLRANPVVGALVARALASDDLPGLPGGTPGSPGSPLGQADLVVLASYGVGTSQAATLTVLVTTAPVEGAIRLADDLVVLGPPAWTAQVEARAALVTVAAAQGTRRIPLVAAPELLRLRDQAMPPKAPGAALRVTATLSFEARVALARQTGLDAPPARLSVWADVVDDLAIIIDADADDPGDRKPVKKGARRTDRLETGLRGLLAALAEVPAIRALGLPVSLQRARLVAKGSWVRTIISIGPTHLGRVVQRARAYLEEPS